jgi:hypothetical protein
LDSKRGERAKVEIHLRRAFFFSMIRTRNTSWRPVLRGPRPWDPRASPGSGPESSVVVVVEKMRGLWNLVSFDVKWLFSIHRIDYGKSFGLLANLPNRLPYLLSLFRIPSFHSSHSTILSIFKV